MQTGIIIAGATLLLAGFGVRAADDRGNSPTLSIAQDSGGLFRADETTLDLFGGLTLNESTTD